jgi:hypothetical protein
LAGVCLAGRWLSRWQVFVSLAGGCLAGRWQIDSWVGRLRVGKRLCMSVDSWTGRHSCRQTGSWVGKRLISRQEAHGSASSESVRGS